MKFLTDTLGVG